jgi:5-methylcytosine-specific restriction endonuclease McrA
MDDSTISIDFECVNCDQVFVVSRHATLYCSQRCRQDSKLVRYVRACLKDGRVEDPLVRGAIRTRFAFAYSEKGYYDEKARQVPPDIREKVIERASGLCEQCGAVGTEIDHINGDSYELDNLQLLCHDCHSEKTEANMVPLTPDHERYEEITARETELRSRIDAPTPLRPCDDESSWKGIFQELIREQWRLLKRIKEDVEGKANGRDSIEDERITDELNELAVLESQLEALEVEKKARKNEILTPEMQVRLNAIDKEYVELAEPLDEAISAIRARIKERSEQYRLTVKGSGFQVVWRNGPVRWDTKGLDEYAKTHPEVLQYKREGKGSAAILPAKKRQM